MSLKRGLVIFSLVLINSVSCSLTDQMKCVCYEAIMKVHNTFIGAPSDFQNHLAVQYVYYCGKNTIGPHTHQPPDTIHKHDTLPG